MLRQDRNRERQTPSAPPAKALQVEQGEKVVRDRVTLRGISVACEPQRYIESLIVDTRDMAGPPAHRISSCRQS